MNWFTKLLTFLTPPPTKVDEVIKRKILKQAVKEATVKLDKFKTTAKTTKKKPAKKVVKITTKNIGE